MRSLQPLLAALLGATLFPLPGASLQEPARQPREEILSYDVDIQVETDGWMEVTEEIRVRALGDEYARVRLSGQVQRILDAHASTV